MRKYDLNVHVFQDKLDAAKNSNFDCEKALPEEGV